MSQTVVRLPRVCAQQATPWLKLENENGRTGGEGGAGLQRQYQERLSRKARQPRDREECNDRYLSGHEYLKDVGGGPFIGLMHNTEPYKVNEQGGEDDERHCYRKKGARFLDHC
jgi:hypothetical protein